MNEDAFLEDDTVYLRPFNVGDTTIWAQWFNDKEVTRFMNKGLVPVTDKDQLDHLKKMQADKSNIQLAIVERSSGLLIGSIGLHNIDWVHRTGSISILIGEKKAISKGYGTAAIALMIDHAFSTLNLRKINAGMWAANKASETCFRRNGFILEGRKMQQYFCDGKYVDELNYGLLRTYWEEERKKSK